MKIVLILAVIVITVSAFPSGKSDDQKEILTIKNGRTKRAVIFRPLFVYRQQQVKRQRISDRSDNNQKSSSKPKTESKTKNSSSENQRLYQRYNPNYAPYQYGQSYPYRRS